MSLFEGRGSSSHWPEYGNGRMELWKSLPWQPIKTFRASCDLKHCPPPPRAVVLAGELVGGDFMLKSSPTKPFMCMTDTCSFLATLFGFFERVFKHVKRKAGVVSDQDVLQ